MQSLGVQAANLIQKRFDRVVEQAAKPFLLEVFGRMNQLTLGGRTFDGLKYDSQYGSWHTKTRQEGKKYQTDYVDLRMGNRRIERYRYTNEGSKSYAEIGFETPSDGQIFYEHHFGKVLNGRNNAVYREIFPKVWNNVPQDIKKGLMKRIGNVMNGRNA